MRRYTHAAGAAQVRLPSKRKISVRIAVIKSKNKKGREKEKCFPSPSTHSQRWRHAHTHLNSVAPRTAISRFPADNKKKPSRAARAHKKKRIRRWRRGKPGEEKWGEKGDFFFSPRTRVYDPPCVVARSRSYILRTAWESAGDGKDAREGEREREKSHPDSIIFLNNKKRSSLCRAREGEGREKRSCVSRLLRYIIYEKGHRAYARIHVKTHTRRFAHVETSTHHQRVNMYYTLYTQVRTQYEQ